MMKLGRLPAILFLTALAPHSSLRAQDDTSMFQSGHMGGNCGSCHVTGSEFRYQLDPASSLVVYSVDAYGLETVGTFAEIGGGFVYDESDVASGSVIANIRATSVDTQNDALDSLILSERLLSATEFPLLSFQSTSVARTGEDVLRVDGMLTIRGVANPVSLDVRMSRTTVHPMTGRQTAGFVASGHVNRSDYGLTVGLPAIADQVDFTIYAQGYLAQ